MEKARIKADIFLREQNLSPDQFDIDEVVAVFQKEMAQGLTPLGSSIPMYPSFIEDRGRPLLYDTPVAVIDAGGTNLRTALITFREGKEPLIEGFQTFGMPGIEREVSAREFFSLLADYAAPVVKKSDYLGFCFSYPMIQNDAHDGVVRIWTKEVKAPEVIGMPVAQGLKDELARRGISLSRDLVILNDTVATLLAGRTAGHESSGGVSDYIGFIFGTGQNCSYYELNEKITKVRGLESGISQVINMESGNFALAPRTDLDEAFQLSTENPELNRFEKFASGAYLGPFTGFVLASEKAASFFSPAAAKKLKQLKLKSIDIDRFMRDPRGIDCDANPLAACFGPEESEDRIVAWSIVDALLERAAKAVAVNLSAVVLWGGHGTDPTSPVRLCVDGSTFYKLATFRPRVEYYLKEYLKERNDRHYEIVHLDNAPLLGAAVAGLTG